MNASQLFSGTRSEANGQREAAAHVIDQWFDFLIQTLQIQRRMVLAGLDMMAGSLYSAVDEASATTRRAMDAPRDE